MRLPCLRPATTAISAVALVTGGLVVGPALGGFGAAAVAAPPDHEMPFPCGQAWTGSTRASHSPSPLAIDWNRPDDVGDPVVASASGRVSVADRVDNGGYGRYVVVDHDDRSSSLYAHLSTVDVSVGQAVGPATRLGTVGTTGRSTGPHLHYEQRVDRRVVAPAFSGVPFIFGSTLVSRNCGGGQVPLAGRFFRDRRANLAIYRRGTPSEFRIRRPGGAITTLTFGRSGDDPVVGDWDGNGRLNVGVHRSSRRAFFIRSRTIGVVRTVYGRSTDRPVAGDWDGDGRWEIGVRRPSTSTFYLRSASGTTSTVRLGDEDDLPVTGDWNGDARTDVGVFDKDTARFTLRFEDADGLPWTTRVRFGSPGDLPVAGDWDANGRTDLGVWTPSTATFTLRHSPNPSAPTASVSTVPLGDPE